MPTCFNALARTTGWALVLVCWANACYATTLTLTTYSSGYTNPVFLTAAPGDTSRQFVVEQPGYVRIIKNGTKLSTPFLDVRLLVTPTGGEQGLLGMAFHPNYGANGFFYVNYTNTVGDTVVARYTVSGNPDVANPASASILFTIAQPFANHNGGMLAFGPNDGYLYVGMGDGGSGNDPGNRAQDLSVPLGKMLRIDVDSASPYAVPANNPFKGQAGKDERIWAYGLRNPWRFSFDRTTGELYIGDVGQGAREEIDFQPASSTGGENYGWKIAEGFACAGGSGTCGTSPGFTPPIYDYPHPLGAAVIGGYVYRGSAMPEMVGAYFFCDELTHKFWTLHCNAGVVSGVTDRSAELGPSVGIVSSFGEDASGELYVLDWSAGVIRKIIPLDSDGDGLTDAQEVTYGTNPHDPDTDHDHLNDGDEVLVYHTDPLNPDSDGDGVSDGTEAAAGHDPNNPADTPVLPATGIWGILVLGLALGCCGGVLLVRKPRYRQ